MATHKVIAASPQQYSVENKIHFTEDNLIKMLKTPHLAQVLLGIIASLIDEDLLPMHPKCRQHLESPHPHASTDYRRLTAYGLFQPRYRRSRWLHCVVLAFHPHPRLPFCPFPVTFAILP